MRVTRLLSLWWTAMKAEGHSPVRWALPLLLEAVRSMPFVSGRQWRSRMRACMRCPIYHRPTRRCRMEEPRLGCGCSCPVKFLFAGETCWARAEKIEGLGWPRNIS